MIKQVEMQQIFGRYVGDREPDIGWIVECLNEAIVELNHLSRIVALIKPECFDTVDNSNATE